MTASSGPAAAHNAPARATEGAATYADRALLALLVLAAFGLYWATSFLLLARGGTTHFGADTPLYAGLAGGDAVERITRFHPLTSALALTWMKLLAPLTAWIAPVHLLKAMFAAIGAAGVGAAAWGFAAILPRRTALLWAAIYGVSLGVWYFSAIEESKIVSGSLASLYIAAYLHLRARWTLRGALILTAILLVACLNEIVAGFLVLIPAADTLLNRGLDLRHGYWIGLHALAGPAALGFLEFVVSGRILPVETDPEAASHFSMLIYYLLDNDFRPATAYSFVVNWLFFNLAAPAREALYVWPHWPDNRAYFEPALLNYLRAPASAALVIAALAVAAAAVLPRWRGARNPALAGLLPALLAYSLLRAVFFYLFNPFEPLLFSPSVTLAHLIAIAVPFSASTFPAKPWLLGATAALLLVTNGLFMNGP